MVFRSLLVAALVLSALPSAYASDLGPDNRLHFASDALLTVDFEDATATSAVVQQLTSTGLGLQYSPSTPALLQPLMVVSNDALEGKTSLHVTDATAPGFAIVEPTLFAAWIGKRVSVSFWGRAEGMEPYLTVTYGNAADYAVGTQMAWAVTTAIRTGRETSDGWVEYSTGAIDGSLLDQPIHDITLSARLPTSYGISLLVSGSAGPGDLAMTVDAVEVRPADGSVNTGACTLATQDTDCKGIGECFYGRCVDGAAVWNPAPPLAMQQEIVARFAYFITSFLGDRHAVASLPSGWASKTAALASATASAHSFWGGLEQQIMAVRDPHTSFGGPFSHFYTPFTPLLYTSSGPLDVCFGPTLNDLGDGNLAFVVWQVGQNAGSSLKVGDVVTAIDGMDPKAWADLALARYNIYMPNDARAVWAPEASELAGFIAAHAKSLTVSRCVGGTCTAQSPIDVPAAALAAIGSVPSVAGTYGTLTCGDRFTDLVSSNLTDQGGGDALAYKALDASTVGIEFNGFSPSEDSLWQGALDKALMLTHTQVIVDARVGHGGENFLGDYMLQQFRSTSDPAFLGLASRGAFDDPDPAALTAFDWTPCEMYDSTWQCSTADIDIYAPSSATAPGEASKVAWLNTDDFSNNDMVPLLLQGRANLRIFAPFPTYGAYGSDVTVPPYVPSWYSSYIAASDARYGTSIATLEAQTSCESGTGVVPDQVSTQTLSDVLLGTDTMITAAKAWLAQ